MGVVQAVGGIITNTKIDYDCPGCGKRVWAYPGFVGNRCWDCPGTLTHGVTRAVVGNTPIVSDIIDNVANTTLDAVTDNRQYYYCPHCGKEKYAYGMFKGTTCFECGKFIGAIADGARKAIIDNTIKTVSDPKFISQTQTCEKHLSPHGMDMDGTIWRVKVKSIWLIHGAWAAPLSGVTGIVSNNSLTHWWVSIEMLKSDEYYCCQFNGGNELEITKHKTEQSVTQEGKNVLVFGSNSHKNITVKHEVNPTNKTMRHVVQFMQRFDGKYDLNDNNCQVFARALFKHLC